ncbi:NAD(P)-dependent alcohol dehydrogenase [Actinosynnema sp. CS-041913]|uniref:NAD(P)-dependent alcohol dehydrogenase n=1 Tax=Actinosynnema sp. CS-041913 TaxID=3239917 RepID=UPI003D9468A0
MKAIRYETYGAPEVLRLQDVDLPEVGPRDVLVRVRAAGVNPLDSHFVRGTPFVTRAASGLARPGGGLGADLAGQVEQVGAEVTRFAVGDEVFGGRGTSAELRSAAFAEYACFREDAVLLAKPENLTFEQAAAVPVAALSALQALRDVGRLQAGQRVLVNGAAGGVGSFAVQFAKAFDAHVTGVCRGDNVDLVRALGADRVVDYTAEDFTKSESRPYDLILDMAGNRALAEIRRALTPRGTLVGIGQKTFEDHLVSPLLRPVGMLLLTTLATQRLMPFLARNRREDLATVGELLTSGKARPVIDRTYPLDQVADAITYVEQGHTRGKVVVTV